MAPVVRMERVKVTRTVKKTVLEVDTDESDKISLVEFIRSIMLFDSALSRWGQGYFRSGEIRKSVK